MLVKLKDICTIKSSKRIFEKEYVESGIPFIRGKEITDKSILNPLGNFECYISKERYEELKETYGVPQIGDILMTAVGTVGNTCYINKQIDFYYKDGNVIQFTNFSKNVNSKYLYFFFNSSLFIITLNNILIGAVQKALTMDMLKEIEIDLPIREIQDKIANILSNIDNQIERNNAMTKRLQIMAQTTYSRWFNQFEFPNNEGKPYKSNGGELVYNKELGKEIPADWNVDNLYKIASFENGLACQKYRPVNETDKLPVIKITEMHNGFTKETEFCRNDVKQKHIIENGDLLFSWSATLETQIWCGGKGVLNQHIFNVIPKEYFSKYYVYLQLTSYIQNFVKIAESRKTTMGHITTDHLKQSKIIIPPNDVMNKFTALTNPIYLEIINLNIETIKLIELKEKLLPLLINGQLNI